MKKTAIVLTVIVSFFISSCFASSSNESNNKVKTTVYVKLKGIVKIRGSDVYIISNYKSRSRVDYLVQGSLKGKLAQLNNRVVEVKGFGRRAGWSGKIYVKKIIKVCKSKSISKSIDNFAFELLRYITNNSSGNVSFSPYSIYNALLILYIGSGGKSKIQISKTLKISKSDYAFLSQFKSLNKTLSAEKNKNQCEFYTANALWVQKDFPILVNFTKMIRSYFKGSLFKVNFNRKLRLTVKKINSWIKEKTNGRIKNLLKKTDVDNSIRLIITNTIYFYGQWLTGFKKNNTHNLYFYLSNNKKVRVPFMHQQGNFLYFNDRQVKVIELTYKNRNFSTILVLPKDKTGITKIEKTIKFSKLNYWLKHLHKAKINIYLPKFTLEKRYYLSNILSKMGIKALFSDKANLSNMTPVKKIRVAKFIHQAFVKINEKGTEAAATTAVTIRLTAIMHNATFKANHPFLFFIIHNKSKVILFIGILRNPAKAQINTL